MSLAADMAKPFAGIFNRVRLGFPSHYFVGTGGIGDDLMCTTVFRELKKRGSGRIAMATRHPLLFQGNPDVDHVIHNRNPRLSRWLLEGLPLVRLGYSDYDPVRDADEPLNEHVLVKICRLAGVNGEIELRPYLHLKPEEIAAGKLADRQIVIQSSAQGAPWPMKNKEWYLDRFQVVCGRLSQEFKIFQLGAASDPALAGVEDLRGKTTLRQSAAILSNSLVLIGLEGFLMHLARAVDCRSVIIYGGRIKPTQIGYAANENLYSPVECSPCWLRNRCDYDRKCMDMISVEQVITAARKQIARHETPLEVQTAVL
jgi:ADP-heptose:LPS heptosyltransferase